MKTRFLWKFLRIAVAAFVLLSFGAAFSGIGGALFALPQMQFGPILMKSLTAFSVGALAVALGIAALTFLFGRFYCAALCPFGILQDVIGFLSRRKGRAVPNFSKFRYAVAGIAFGMLLFGWSALFFLLDPYSNFGRIVASFSIGGMIPLLGIAILSIWKKRIYCTTICPVGTLLGLLAKHGLFRLHLTDPCVKCGMCVKVCPAGCIEPQKGTLDNERCVRCMNCVSVCRFQAVKFSLPDRNGTFVDPSRRAFLIHGGVLIAGLATGMVLAKIGMGKLKEYAKRFRILPPGAGNAERFAARCTACQLCVANCPEKIIVSSPRGGTVSLDLSRGACRFDCNQCSQLCPTGAIAPLTLSVKQKTKIAEAKFQPRNCIVFQEGSACGKCANACPTGAITLRTSGAPRPVNVALCIGCGACQSVCPAPEKAMTVHEIEQQQLLL